MQITENRHCASTTKRIRVVIVQHCISRSAPRLDLKQLIAHKNSLEIFKYLLYALLYKDKTIPLPKTERRLANNTVGNVKQT